MKNKKKERRKKEEEKGILKTIREKVYFMFRILSSIVRLNSLFEFFLFFRFFFFAVLLNFKQWKSRYTVQPKQKR